MIVSERGERVEEERRKGGYREIALYLAILNVYNNAPSSNIDYKIVDIKSISPLFLLVSINF